MQGLNDGEITTISSVPRTTVRDWRRGSFKNTSRSRELRTEPCLCAQQLQVFPSSEYAYLLGLYLGDGYISSGRRRVWRLRITLDAKYPGIIEQCALAMEAVLPGKRAYRFRRKGCVEVSMYSKHWTCFFPQHGPGRKHHRRIKLEPWQQTLVQRESERFLLGLIHSDGSRTIANDRGRPSTRYHFSNRSEDIRQLFCAALDRIGVRWTQPSQHSIAVYRKDGVNRLDEFIGAKH
jgi:hypothetical protein